MNVGTHYATRPQAPGAQPVAEAIGQSRDVPDPAPASAARPGRGTPPVDARLQRRAVKRIAGSLDSDLRELKNIGMLNTDVDQPDRLLERLKSKQRQLQSLQGDGFDTTRPAATGMRRFRSGALLVLAMPTRAVATVVAAIVAVPSTVACYPTLTTRAFRAIDQVPKARARADRKKMSSSEIAAQIDRALGKAIIKATDRLESAEFFSSAPRVLQEMAQELGAAAAQQRP